LTPSDSRRCVGVDLQHHRLHELPLLQHLGGMLDALGPTHVGNVDQAVDAFLDLDEGAEIGELANAAFHHRADAVALLDRGPGVRLELLDAQRNAAVLGLHLQHHGTPRCRPA
jgi:hypothetical protein